jgi:hypothetical protein
MSCRGCFGSYTALNGRDPDALVEQMHNWFDALGEKVSSGSWWGFFDSSSAVAALNDYGATLDKWVSYLDQLKALDAKVAAAGSAAGDSADAARRSWAIWFEFGDHQVEVLQKLNQYTPTTLPQAALNAAGDAGSDITKAIDSFGSTLKTIGYIAVAGLALYLLIQLVPRR